ncbi:asparagine synthase-related protein [Terriglobus sp. 2YAB30_2]|uniref:asparagine synthase-related protein n=1 Tax=unclassified Terriglobus TaxID=2628988 RepID=UPI003F9EAD32
MMRSALRSIVPTEIIERRRKAARSRSLLLTLRRQEERICDLFSEMSPTLAELVEPEILRKSVSDAFHKSDLAATFLAL